MKELQKKINYAMSIAFPASLVQISSQHPILKQSVTFPPLMPETKFHTHIEPQENL
jgi:hypothetical protein